MFWGRRERDEGEFPHSSSSSLCSGSFLQPLAFSFFSVPVVSIFSWWLQPLCKWKLQPESSWTIFSKKYASQSNSKVSMAGHLPPRHLSFLSARRHHLGHILHRPHHCQCNVIILPTECLTDGPKVGNPEACQEFCLNDKTCASFTWSSPQAQPFPLSCALFLQVYISTWLSPQILWPHIQTSNVTSPCEDCVSGPRRCICSIPGMYINLQIWPEI